MPAALLVVRLLAVYFAVLAVLDATSLTFYLVQVDGFASGTRESWALASAITIGLDLLTALLLFFFSPRIARSVSPAGPSQSNADVSALGPLALRLAGIFVVNSGLQHLPRIVGEWKYLVLEESRENFIQAGLLFLTVLGLGCGLILAAKPLARKLFGSAPDANREASALAQAVGFSIVGLYFVTLSVPGLVERAYVGLSSRVSDTYLAPMPSAARTAVAIEVLRVAFGLGIFFTSGMLARMWHRLRTAGLTRPVDS